jgi:hypothetical protein
MPGNNRYIEIDQQALLNNLLSGDEPEEVEEVIEIATQDQYEVALEQIRALQESLISANDGPSVLTREAMDSLIGHVHSSTDLAVDDDSEASVEYTVDVQEDGGDWACTATPALTIDWHGDVSGRYTSSSTIRSVPRVRRSLFDAEDIDDYILETMDADRRDLETIQTPVPIIVVLYDEEFVTAMLESSCRNLRSYVRENTDYDMEDCYTYLLRECPVHTAKLILDFDKGGKPFNGNRHKLFNYIHDTEIRMRDW